MNGVNDLEAVDALLDGMGVTELVGCEATTHISRSGGVSELAAS